MSLYVWLVLTALRIACHLDGFVVQVLFIPFGSLLLFRILGFAGIDLFATWEQSARVGRATMLS